MDKAKIAPLTDDAYEKAVAAGSMAKSSLHSVAQAWVAPMLGSSYLGLNMLLRNDTVVSIPIHAIEELASYSFDVLSQVQVDALGEGLIWPQADIGISTLGLLDTFFGYATRAKIASAGGKRSTPAKVAAARENGKRGGRKAQRAA